MVECEWWSVQVWMRSTCMALCTPDCVFIHLPGQCCLCGHPVFFYYAQPKVHVRQWQTLVSRSSANHVTPGLAMLWSECVLQLQLKWKGKGSCWDAHDPWHHIASCFPTVTFCQAQSLSLCMHTVHKRRLCSAVLDRFR